jgi:membrane protease YdiL (CAAX protease family)
MTSQSGAWPGPVGRPARAHWWSAQPPPPPAGRISARRAYAEVLLVFAAFFAASVVAGGETLAGRYPPPSGSWAIFSPATISELGTSALAILVVILLSARRGITARSLGLSWPRKGDGTQGVAQSLRIGVWAVLALLAGGAVTTALAMGNKLGQPAHQDASYLIYAVGAAVTAGIVEEMVVLAFVVTTLRQAARPLPEIVLVAVLLRCSYHDYYGLGVLGIAVWATVFIWLFLRTGSILPLIVVHIAWDASIFLGQRWHAIPLASASVYLLLFVVATLTWLGDFRARSLARPAPLDGMLVTAPRAAGPLTTGPLTTGPLTTGPPAVGPPATGPPATGPPVAEEPPLRLGQPAGLGPSPRWERSRCAAAAAVTG